MGAVSHSGKSCHGLSLASCSDKNSPVIRVLAQVVYRDKRLVRDLYVAELLGDIYDSHHAAALYDYFSAVLISCVNDLLHSVYIRSKGSDDDTVVPVLRKNVVKLDSDSAL